MNQITARLNHPDAGDLYKDCFCYDDAEQGLIAEPLVHQTTAVIHKLFGGQAPEVITLTFSSEGDPQWKQDEHPIASMAQVARLTSVTLSILRPWKRPGWMPSVNLCGPSGCVSTSLISSPAGLTASSVNSDPVGLSLLESQSLHERCLRCVQLHRQ
jgi:hypothetical protein